MDVQTQDMIERVKETLRAKVNDPFSRGTDIIGTLSTGNNTFSTNPNKRVKNVNHATGASTNTDFYRFQDYSVSFDDPSDDSDYTEIVFDTTPTEDVEISYHHKDTWIYPTFPKSSITDALISIKHVSTSTDRRFIGQKIDSSTNAVSFVSSWQIDVWVEDGASVEDPGNKTGHYAGGKLADYISDQVVSAFTENLEMLSDIGVQDARLTSKRDEEWQSDAQRFRKRITFDLLHRHEW